MNWNYQKLLGPYTGWNQYFTTLEKFWVFSEKGDPWGGLSAPEATSGSSFLSFLSDLLKDSEHVRITNAQKHFKSTFGSAYLISEKMKLRLAKTNERELRKASFPWDLGLLFVQPMKVNWYCIILNFIIVKGKLMHVIYKFSLKFMQKDDFPKARSRMLMKLF